MILAYENDTIAALATPPGRGGIAIVRVSGENACAYFRALFTPAGQQQVESHRLLYGWLRDEKGALIDECMGVVMLSPRSYTREDVAEFHTHGGEQAAQAALHALYALGARPAEPGEFTRRAFLNGRIDLTQAEAVMRMIRAGSDRAMTSAIRQMEGGVSSFVRTAREEIIALLAELAAAIDFPDEVEESETAQQVHARCGAIRARLLADCDPRAGRIEDEGLRVVLCGRPNAGKSSLLNALVGGERAIVTDIPGTTRDTLTESIQIDGLRVCLTDTAGLRETGDAVERIGVARARKALDEADVRVLVLDSSCAIDAEDREALYGLAPNIVVLSKGDLPPVITPQAAEGEFPGARVVSLCAPRGEGLDALKRLLVSFAPEDGAESSMLCQARHVQAAMHAGDALQAAQAAIEAGMPLDVCVVDLSDALEALGEITGETMNEQVIDEVFARFCVGK